MRQDDIFYQAMLSRDYRFDGKFFVGVKTTGIYCRPICPARPKRENVLFFQNHLAAEKAGFRPCLRCRPEAAPLSPAWIGKSAVVQRAIKMIHEPLIKNFDEDKFAELFGVTARHLRRLFMEEIGKTPKQLVIENRLNVARKLIVETPLPISEVAFASGFNSIRRFNDSFKDRFKKRPSDIRRNKNLSKDILKISLSYRPPYDYQGLIHFYQSHQVGNLEWFEDQKMFRVVEFKGKIGVISISNDHERSQLNVEIDFPDTSAIHYIISKVRSLMDLDSDPLLIANSVEIDQKLKKILKKHQGIRLPTGWDGFEVSVSTILGQLVSVQMGRTLVSDLIEMLGTDTGKVINGKSIKLFPTPAQIANSTLEGLRTTSSRKQTLRTFSKLLLEKKLSLEPTQNVDEFVKKLLSIRGIGPWSASYMALKVLRHSDAFPITDLIIARALSFHPEEIINKMSPWRGYVTALLWREYSQTLTKSKKRSLK